MVSTRKRRRGRAAALGACLVVTLALTGCAHPSLRDGAIDAARAKFEQTRDGLQAELPQLPATDLRSYIISSYGLGGAGSLIGWTQEELRTAGLQQWMAYVLDADTTGDIATVLFFVSGFHTAGSGDLYKQESAFTCFTAKIDLTEKAVLGYEGAHCTDDVYALLARRTEFDFSLIAQ